jgi:hypothetical protein
MYDGKFDYDLGEGVKKLSYYTYKLMTEKLADSDWGNIEAFQEPDNVYVYKFTKKNTGKPVWVIWWDYSNEKGHRKKTATVSLKVNSGKVTVTTAIPDAGNRTRLTNEHTFKTEIKQTSKGSISISLGDDLVYVEEGVVPPPVYKIERKIVRSNF